MGRETVENLDAKVVDNVFTMYLPIAKYSRGKNNLPFESLGRVYSGRPKAEGKLKYAANVGINKTCPIPRSH
jgi:hypothetical protein